MLRRRLKNFDKKYRARFINLVKVLTIMLMGVCAFLFYMYIFDTNISPINLASNIFTTSIYKSKAISHLDDNISIEVSQLCSMVPSSMQARCVVEQVTPYYTYNYSDHILFSPDEFVQNGGVCRDIAIIYNTIFSRLGWSTYYEFNVPHHVYLIVVKQDANMTYRCLIDGAVYNCEEWEGST